MISQRDDPIIALATPPGRGAIGVIRISGKDLKNYIYKLTARYLKPRAAQLVIIKDDSGNQIDQVLALYFPAPHSYTGEDILELQGHGGSVVLQMLIKHCLSLANATRYEETPCLPYLRLARPGEFTERAYLNHKIDLIQAEAVADLIDANTEAAARSAVNSLEGEFSSKVMAIKENIINLRLQIEACLDFPEEDIDFIEQLQVRCRIEKLRDGLIELIKQAEKGRLLRDGLKLVIAGLPNVGKSSILNALSGVDAAIVTEIAGTTRDILTQSIEIEGVPIYLLDTAGIRDLGLADQVEKIGISRAWEQISNADMVMVVQDLSLVGDISYGEKQKELLNSILNTNIAKRPVLIVNNKIDKYIGEREICDQEVFISALTGEGIENLKKIILETSGKQLGLNEGVKTARYRHLNALHKVQIHLDNAVNIASVKQIQIDLLAEEIRLAQNELSVLTGNFTSDDLLGEIFSRFCIGK